MWYFGRRGTLAASAHYSLFGPPGALWIYLSPVFRRRVLRSERYSGHVGPLSFRFRSPWRRRGLSAPVFQREHVGRCGILAASVYIFYLRHPVTLAGSIGPVFRRVVFRSAQHAGRIGPYFGLGPPDALGVYRPSFSGERYFGRCGMLAAPASYFLM